MYILKSIGLAALGYLLTLFAVDVYLQNAEIYTPMKTRIRPDIGPTFAPGTKVTRFNEGFSIGEINDQGYIGPSVPKIRPAGERRILLIGDSYVVGQQLFQRDHFGTRLQELLDPEEGGSVKVLNFGQGDFNLSNMYQYYQDFASEWDHDLALFFLENQDLYLPANVNTALYPRCTMDGDSLRIDYSFRDSKDFKRYKFFEPYAARISFFRMALVTRQTIIRGGLTELLFDKFAPLFPAGAPARMSKRKLKGLEEVSPVAKGILRALAANPKAVVVLKKEIVGDNRSLLQEYGLPIWDLHPVMEEMESRDVDPYYWKVTRTRGHWNHEAHAGIAAYLSEMVKAHPLWRQAVTTARRAGV